MPYRDPIQALACEAIDSRLKGWLTRLPADLSALPAEAYEDVQVEGRRVTFGTHRQALDQGGTLVVFQALVHTWARPNFFSRGGIGRMYAEGLVVSAGGRVERASEEVMSAFR
jgi:hypothetical protein